MYKLITYFLIITYSTCFADQPVVSLDKGQAAPFSGFLFDSVKEKQLRLLNETDSYYKSLTNSLTVINKVQSDNLDKMQERITLRDTQIDNLNKRLNDNDTGLFSKAFYFIAGGLVVGILAQGIYRSK